MFPYASKLLTARGLHSKCWFSGPVIIQGSCDMTLHLEGVHICHILNTGFEDCIFIHFQPKNEIKILVKMEGICMAKADSHVTRAMWQGKPQGTCLLCSWGYNNTMLPARDSWRVNTAHVSSFVLISILRGQPRTPPSGENLGVLDYHLNIWHSSIRC